MSRNVKLSLTMFDLLKGTAMIAVILLHSIDWDIQEQIGWKMLYSVLMPAFFVTSGYWMKPRKITAGIKGAAKQILRPYLLTILAIEGIGLVHRLATGNFQNWLDVFFLPGLLGMSGPGTRFGPLWFLLALFWAWVFFYLTASVENERLQIGLAVLSGIAGGAWISFNPPFQLAQGLIGFFYLYCGYYLKKKKLLQNELELKIALPAVLYWLLMVYFGSMDMGMYRIRYGFLSIVGSLFGAVILIRFFLRIDFMKNPVADGLRTVGRYTMWILCVHGLEGAVVPWNILFRYVEKDTWAGCFLWFVLRLTVVAVGCAVLEQWNRIRLRRMIAER